MPRGARRDKRERGRLLACWVTPEFHAAFKALTSTAGVTQSDVIRDSVVRAALEVAALEQEESGADRDG
jgi:hypothetical protein